MMRFDCSRFFLVCFLFFTHIFLLQWDCNAFSEPYAIQNFSQQEINFESVDDIEHIVSSVKDSDILIVKFNFDPFEPDILSTYLPNGYITINGEYDVFEMMLKTFFRPIVSDNNIKILLLDLNFFLKKDHQKNIAHIKNLVERISVDFSRRRYKTTIGLKFKYSKDTQEKIDALFEYSSLAHIKAIQIDSGYADLISQKRYEPHIKNWTYLSLENNRVGANNSNFLIFLDCLKKFKKLTALNLAHNAIGSEAGEIKSLTDQIVKMPRLQYISLENNLVGVFQDDTTILNEFMGKNKSVYINLESNYSVSEFSTAHR